MRKLLALACLAFVIQLKAALPSTPELPETPVPWPEFLSRQDMNWESLPDDWWNGLFVGNGVLGAMIYKESDTTLAWELGRGDVYDHRALEKVDWLNAIWSRARLPIGSFKLHTAGRILGASPARIDLWNAEARGTLLTDKGSIRWRCFAHATEPVLVVELETEAGEKTCSWEWSPALSRTSRTKKQPAGVYLPNPAGTLKKSPEGDFWHQPMLAGGEYVTAWRETTEPKRKVLWVNIEYTRQGEAASAAASTLSKVSSEGLDKALERHQAWWHEFYPRHFLSVPDAALESFYWKQVYKLGSAMRPEGPLCDLMGPWYHASDWPGLWWNLNVQFTYYPIYTANLLPLGESLTRALDRNVGNLRLNAGRDFPDSAAIGRATGMDLRADVLSKPYEVGNLPWTLHNYWLQYRYSMDEALLRERVLPLLRQSTNYYLRLMTAGSDGLYHLPPTLSPEYDTTEDCSYDLALFRWELRTLITEHARLGLEDPLMPVWKDAYEKLIPVMTDSKGFRIGKQFGFDRPHHHYSHLLSIFPLHLMDLEAPAQRELARKSVDHYIGLSRGAYQNNGAAAMYATLGLGDKALPLLREFVAQMTTQNTFIKDGGNPCIEAPLHFNRSLQEMLLQSWGGVIRVFPAIPSSWQELSFSSLRTEGAFLVDARRSRGLTQFIRITSLAGAPCRLQTSLLPAKPIVLPSTVSLRQLPGGLTELSLAKGETVLLRSTD